MAFINEKAHDQSAKLAEERGPFPNWPRSHLQARAAAPELDGHDHRAHGHDLDDRRVLLRGRAGVRGRLHPQGGRPGAALHEPDLRRGGPGARVLLGRAHGGDRQAGRRPRPGRGAGGRPARLRDGARGGLRVARPAPGRLPEVHGQRRLQDHQPAQLGVRRRRRARLPPRLGAGVPRHHRVPGRLQGGGPPHRHQDGPRRQARGARPRRRRRSSSPGRGASRAARTASRRRSARPTSSSTSRGTASPSRSSSRWARPGPTRWRSPRPWAA